MKDYKKLVERAKKLKTLHEKRRADRRYLRVIGFLKARGFLFDETITPKANAKLDLKDVLWVAENVEPRVYEVLPAAMIYFPKTFLNVACAPAELRRAIDALQDERELVEPFYGIEFAKIKHWVMRKPNDKRVKTLNEKKVPRTFRLHPQVIAKLEKIADRRKLTETEIIEGLISSAG